jgi:hypothetical protein
MTGGLWLLLPAPRRVRFLVCPTLMATNFDGNRVTGLRIDSFNGSRNPRIYRGWKR